MSRTAARSAVDPLRFRDRRRTRPRTGPHRPPAPSAGRAAGGLEGHRHAGPDRPLAGERPWRGASYRQDPQYFGGTPGRDRTCDLRIRSPDRAEPGRVVSVDTSEPEPDSAMWDQGGSRGAPLDGRGHSFGHSRALLLRSLATVSVRRPSGPRKSPDGPPPAPRLALPRDLPAVSAPRRVGRGTLTRRRGAGHRGQYMITATPTRQMTMPVRSNRSGATRSTRAPQATDSRMNTPPYAA